MIIERDADVDVQECERETIEYANAASIEDFTALLNTPIHQQLHRTLENHASWKEYPITIKCLEL